jgi:hypothetical protein
LIIHADIVQLKDLIILCTYGYLVVEQEEYKYAFEYALVEEFL